MPREGFPERTWRREHDSQHERYFERERKYSRRSRSPDYRESNHERRSGRWRDTSVERDKLRKDHGDRRASSSPQQRQRERSPNIKQEYPPGYSGGHSSKYRSRHVRRDDASRGDHYGRGNGYSREDREQRTERSDRARSDFYDERDHHHEEEDEPQPGLNLEHSGALHAEDNTFRGHVIKYTEPTEAMKPTKKWRLHVFKGNDQVEVLPVSRQSGFLIGRSKEICDLPALHPSISVQHAVLQYRLVTLPDKRQVIRPYIIDLQSVNGTLLNGQRLDARRKKVTKFKRHHSERFHRVKQAWRKPRGIDNRTRRRFKGTRAMPSIGFRTDRRTRFRSKHDGKYIMTIKNVDELKPLLMHSDQFNAQIAGAVSKRSRVEIIKRADQWGITVTNRKAGFRSVE